MTDVSMNKPQPPERGNHWDAIVIGGGPAGLSAALMLGRSRRRVLVLDAGSPRNRFATHMHGVLGREGANPLELLESGRAECASYGVEIRPGAAERVDDAEDGLTVTLAEPIDVDPASTDPFTRVLRARALIIASGMTDELPEIPGLAEQWGTRVLHCPYCHGWEVRDQRLGLLTTSPFGLHLAQLVRQWSNRFVVFTAGIGELDESTEQRLRSRHVELVDYPVTEIVDQGSSLGVRTADGQVTTVDALFTGATGRPHDGFLTHLDLARTDTPMGSFLATDRVGQTSHPRIWAVGNVADPSANVSASIGTASFTGAMVNAVLVEEDFDAAVESTWPTVAPVDFWEERYADSDRVWSGQVNQTLADIAGGLPVGRALDLGCGEGADVVWLAHQGWSATGIDISPTAIRRATAAAEAAGLTADRARFVVGDLSALADDGPYDLVTASFLHSPVELPRSEILRRAADLVVPGGHLLITSHAAAPPWADASAHEHRFLTPAEELDELALDTGAWKTVLAEIRTKQVTSPDGEPAELDDAVLLLRRL